MWLSLSRLDFLAWLFFWLAGVFYFASKLVSWLAGCTGWHPTPYFDQKHKKSDRAIRKMISKLPPDVGARLKAFKPSNFRAFGPGAVGPGGRRALHYEEDQKYFQHKFFEGEAHLLAF